ncbi:MAG: hypothetical protein ABFS21_04465 [Actinomycetota bacterium]
MPGVRMSTGRWVALAACAVIAVVALVSIPAEPLGGGFCTADMILVDVPGGYDLRRDGANDCRWTLYGSAGERAPDEMYEGLAIEPPPRPSIDPNTALAIVVLVAAVGVGAGVVITRPRERER